MVAQVEEFEASSDQSDDGESKQKESTPCEDEESALVNDGTSIKLDHDLHSDCN